MPVFITERFDREIDKESIKRNLVALDFQIGEDVYISRLISAINKEEGFSITDIKIGKSSDNLTATDLVVDVREVARFLDSNIQITGA